MKCSICGDDLTVVRWESNGYDRPPSRVYGCFKCEFGPPDPEIDRRTLEFKPARPPDVFPMKPPKGRQ